MTVRNLIMIGVLISLSACASGPQVTEIQDLSPATDAPYESVLVVALFKSFDARKFFEKEIVEQLSAKGVKAVAGTSLMTTKTPLTRQTFVSMTEEHGADALLVTRLIDLNTVTEQKDRRAQATRNIRPTYYYNVWSYELAEYVQPQAIEYTHSLVLATQLYSVETKEPVWAIESKSTIVTGFEEGRNANVIVDESTAITSRLFREGLVAP